MRKKILALSIIMLFCASLLPINDQANELFDSSHNPMESGSAVRVQITSPSYIISADEVITFLC